MTGRAEPGGGAQDGAAPPGVAGARRSRAPSRGRSSHVRTGIAVFLVVASVLSVTVSAVALWSRGVVFDTDSYVGVVAPVLEDPAARVAVAEYAAVRAVQAVDLEARVEDALPSGAKVLAPAVTGSLRSFLVVEIDRFLGTQRARRLWADGNRFAHRQLITALRDENRAVTVDQYEVRLDLLPLVAVALQRLEGRVPGILGRDVTLPEIEPARAPDEIRTLFRDALGRELQPGFASVTLIQGARGHQAMQALRLFNDLVILAVALTIVLVVAALLVSPRRLQTALWLGLGSLLALVLARAVVARLETAVVDALETRSGAAVARSILGSAIESLSAFFAWVAVAAAIAAVAAVLAGRPGWRDAVARGAAELFGVASDLSTPDTRAGRWLARHLDTLRILGVAVAVAVLLLVTASPTAVVVVVLALAVYELALGAYAVGVPREPGEDATGDPPIRGG